MADLDARLRQLFGEARLEEARALAVGWTEHEPANVTAWQHRSHAEMWCGEVAAAESSCRKVLALAPENWRGRFNLATVLLAQGHFTEAWPLYEARYVAAEGVGSGGFVSFPYPATRLWRGETLVGRRLLLVGEQGFGDQIQFARFVAADRVQAAREILLQVAAPLMGLLQSVPGVTRLMDGLVDDGDYDVWLPLLSLPSVLGPTVGVSVTLPYLSVPDARADRWCAQMETWSKGRRRYGLVWAGSPGNVTDARRSLTLEQAFGIVAAGRGAMPVSLQLGGAGFERLGEQCQRGILPLLDLLSDFAETAAAIQALDLVITVDTAVAHLAGALGKPVWVLLPVGADWRWGIEGGTTPWYPGTRLFRQPAVGDWASVLGRVCDELRAWGAA